LTNTGSGPLNIVTIAVAPIPIFAQTNDCPNTLAPKESCTIAVTFAPEWAGSIPPFAAFVGITTNAPDSPTGFSLGGTGINVRSSALVFPQIVTGGGYKTTFYLVNTEGAAAAGTLILTEQNGNQFWASVAGTSTFWVPISISPGGIQILTADAASTSDLAKSGWARIDDLVGKLGGVASFQSTSAGGQRSAAGVFAAQPTRFATIPVDNDDSQQKYTGYAVANPGNASICIRVAVVDEDGIVLDDTVTITLGPGQQIAKFLHQDLPTRLRFRGSMVLRGQGGTSFVVVALHQNQGRLSVVPVILGKAPNVPD
jgi:hypothetical protein